MARHLVRFDRRDIWFHDWLPDWPVNFLELCLPFSEMSKCQWWGKCAISGVGFGIDKLGGRVDSVVFVHGQNHVPNYFMLRSRARSRNRLRPVSRDLSMPRDGYIASILVERPAKITLPLGRSMPSPYQEAMIGRSRCHHWKLMYQYGHWTACGCGDMVDCRQLRRKAMVVLTGTWPHYQGMVVTERRSTFEIRTGEIIVDLKLIP
jgi:hypothetical protein